MIRQPSRPFVLSAAATAATLIAWGAYLTGHRVILLLPYVVAVAGLVLFAMNAEANLPPPVGGGSGWGPGPEPSWGRPWTLAAAAVLALGLAYRIAEWPVLIHAGDSGDYATMATSAAVAQKYVLMPWRTPGYTLPVTWIYRLAGIGNEVAVHAWQIGLSLLTAALVMAITYRVTRSRPLALLALLIASLAWPMAAPSAFLMTEGQAMFLATLAVYLVLVIHDRRHAGPAALALGLVVALGYETRPVLLPWMAVIAAAALVASGLGWRRRGVLVAGALLTLAPVTAINAQSAFRVVTPGPAVDLVSENLGLDRFTLYWSAPDSPALLDKLYDAIVVDGAETDYWQLQPPAKVASFTRARMATMERSVLAGAGSYAQLCLRRALLFYRYDQQWDMTWGLNLAGAELVLMDLLLALAVVAAATWARRGPWPYLLLLGGLVVSFTASLALFHVEPRYSLPALPIVVVLAMMGLHSLSRLAAAPSPRWGRVGVGAAAAVLVILAVPASEAWLWPALVNDYAPRPALGAHEIAACYVGHELLTSVAWQPGTALVVGGGANGMTTWDTRGDGTCPWQPMTSEDVWDLDFSRDGARLAVGSYHARVIDPRTWRTYPPPGALLTGIGTESLSVSLDPTGDRMAVAATGLHRVDLYDVAAQRVIEMTDLPASPTAVRWSPDGSTIAVAAADDRVRLYDAALNPLGELALPHRPTALAWSPSSRMLAVGDESGSVDLVDTASPAMPVTATRMAHHGAVRGMAFSPDGQSLATAGSDDVARIWTAATLTSTRTLSGDTADVWNVKWSPDSTRVVTASADGTLGLWSAK